MFAIANILSLGFVSGIQWSYELSEQNASASPTFN